MLLKEKTGARAVRLALGLLAGSVLLANPALAQEPQRVEITGSSIKRIAIEGALPVQTISKEAIARSGAASVSDLIQSIPAMQGFTIPAIAVGSNSGGRSSASLRGIGESYTLVLLNGRRLAPQGSGNTVNLNAIPMSAIERVEVLTDGASAIYGSDAIAGVLNFVMKKEFRGTSIEANYTAPMESGGGDSWNTSITWGRGELQKDRYNVFVAYRHDDQRGLKAVERDFAKTSYVPVTHNGNNYIYDRTSTATIPANVTATFTTASGLPAIGFSPYLKKNGNCPEKNFVSLFNTATTQNCAFDFVTAVEIVPSYTRDSVFGKATFLVANDWKIDFDVAASKLDLTARIAPNTAPFTITPTSDAYKTHVLPYLTPAQAAAIRAVSGNYRTYDWGTRDSRTITDSHHYVLSTDGTAGGFDLRGSATWSRNAIDERYTGGYALNKEFREMLANRSFDPFAPIGAQSAETKKLIENSLFKGSVRTASTTLSGFEGGASHALGDLAGGKAQIAVNADYRNYHYKQTPSAASLAGLVYNFNAPPAYDMKRTAKSVMAELVLPFTKELEINAAGRYDAISNIRDGITKKAVGDKMSAATYKVSARYQPNKTWLFRGSYGTGFKAPSMLDIGQPLVNAGFTAASYTCPIAHGEYCRPGKAQYNVYSGGNSDLKPERSKQFNLGFRVEPTANLGFGLDFWDIKLRDAVSSVSEQQAFADVNKYRSLFTTYTEPSTGNTYWAFNSLSVNIGKAHYRGLDYKLTVAHKFDIAKVTVDLNGTRMLKDDYTMPGTDDQFTSNMNIFGVDNNVTFRDILKLTTTVETGNLTNIFTISYRNGYKDALTTVRNTGTNKQEEIRLNVPAYTTLDWQGRYIWNKNLTIRAGIKNLLNKEPPRSLRASSGHQVGFDPRYADPMLRSAYITGNYTF